VFGFDPAMLIYDTINGRLYRTDAPDVPAGILRAGVVPYAVLRKEAGGFTINLK
jgi:hypothetical protein